MNNINIRIILVYFSGLILDAANDFASFEYSFWLVSFIIMTSASSNIYTVIKRKVV